MGVDRWDIFQGPTRLNDIDDARGITRPLRGLNTQLYLKSEFFNHILIK